MSLIERLKLESELKSTVSIGKLFQRFMTRSAKKLDLTELLQKYLKILYGWPQTSCLHVNITLRPMSPCSTAQVRP